MRKKPQLMLGMFAALILVIAVLTAFPSLNRAALESRLRDAIRRNDLAQFEASVSEDVNTKLPAKTINYLILECCRWGRVEMLRHLLAQSSASINFVKDGDTPLLAGALSGKPEMVKLLLDLHADIAVVNEVGSTPVSRAVWSKKAQATNVIAVLIDGGCSVRLEPEVRAAVRIGDTNVIKLLLNHLNASNALTPAEKTKIFKWCENNSRQTKAFLSNYFGNVF